MEATQQRKRPDAGKKNKCKESICCSNAYAKEISTNVDEVTVEQGGAHHPLKVKGDSKGK